MENLNGFWPWYVAGPLIGLTVPVLLLLGNKTFGISSSLRHMCAACVPAKIPFFQYDWKKEAWNLFFVLGVFLGAILAVFVFNGGGMAHISEATIQDLQAMGVEEYTALLPTDVFGWESLVTLRGFFFIIVGGFLVGFGTRWAGGCTSGHAIMGLSNLQWPSLVATICFMIGGFLSTWIIVPLLLAL